MYHLKMSHLILVLQWPRMLRYGELDYARRMLSAIARRCAWRKELMSCLHGFRYHIYCALSSSIFRSLQIPFHRFIHLTKSNHTKYKHQSWRPLIPSLVTSSPKPGRTSFKRCNPATTTGTVSPPLTPRCPVQHFEGRPGAAGRHRIPS